VEWQVCGLCNYACDYCIQSSARRTGQPDEAEVERMLAFLAGLPGEWEVKMTGGEPFASRLFVERIVPALVARTPHRISLLTNLSPGPATLRRFAELCRGRLAVLSASLHLDFTTVDAFLERLSVLREAAGPAARFVVNAVLAPRLLVQLGPAKAAVEAAGFRFFGQLMKVKGGVYAYSAAERARIDTLVGGWTRAEAGRTANLAPAYAGRLCWAGARYFVLTQHGEAWSCRTARRHGEGRLGEVHREGVHLRAGPLACPYAICPCAVPANRGMIEGVPARLGDGEGEA
jgi:hypothetical protein